MKQEIPDSESSSSVDNLTPTSNISTTPTTSGSSSVENTNLPQLSGLSIKEELFKPDSDSESEKEEVEEGFPTISKMEARRTATHAHYCILTHAELKAEVK